VCAGLGIVLTGEWVSWVAIGWKEGREGLPLCRLCLNQLRAYAVSKFIQPFAM
jgi:hypothetical protein